ncbi:PucR family transcriptional regulator [Gordonia rubripertincta]|uniref:Helix-turn-helix domain-containing protein n=1 Tax=Gordonia rubripertincta TaxID=36822 RepID=A0ABT4N3U0_GORRU|nr:helix-turn-helix domain-containing protein [Gordonia rubripertincta]MCZ4553933.1 helix-turn-helix domain-containing protein [Gordonia rubripertincta]
MTSGTATVADLAVATGVQIATTPTTWDTEVSSVVDAGEASDQISLDGAVVVTAWQPARPNGPLPDLRALLDPLIRKKPAAILVSPARPVNPPRQAVALAERAGVCLLWNAGPDSAADVAAKLDRLVSKAQPPAEVHTDSTLLDILRHADDLDALLTAIGDALRASVRLSDTPSEAAVVLPLSGIPGTTPALEVSARDPLGSGALAMLDGLLAVIRLHVKLRDTQSDDASVEIARNLKNILGEDLVQREASLRKSRRLAVFPRHAVACLAIEPFGVSVDMNGLHDLKTSLAPVASRFDPEAITIVNEGVLVVMIRATADLDALARALYRGVQIPLAVGAGDQVDDPRSYPSSFRQAVRAVAVGRRIGAINRVTRYRDLGVLGLLYQLPEHARRNFVDETLGSIADETPDGLDQRRILRVLRSTDCNISESARELFIHPNTLRSRIARIEGVTGPFMNEPDRRLTIFTALSMFSLDSNVEGD